MGLVGAIRKGDEPGVWEELDMIVHTPFWPKRLRAIPSDEAMRLVERGGAATRVALSSHPDGRVREAALRILEPEGGATLPALLQRANDWVPVVAILAARRAAEALATTVDNDLVRALPAVFALTRQSRVDHRSLVQAYRAEVGRRKGLAARIRRANGGGATGLWAFFNLIGDDETAESVARDGLINPQARVQLDAARQMAKDPQNAPLLVASRQPAVRRLGLDVATPEMREELLSDPHAGVRNDARHLLGKRDYAAWYAARLPEPGAVSGLGEVGKRPDAEALRPLLTSRSAEVRRRAVEALARLLETDAEAELRAALRDPSRPVQRAAAEALCRLPLALDPYELAELDLAKGAAWRLLNHAPRWPALLAVLANLESFPDARGWLTSWARRHSSYIKPPTSSEANDAVLMLGTTLPMLNSEAAQALREAVRPWLRGVGGSY